MMTKSYAELSVVLHRAAGEGDQAKLGGGGGHIHQGINNAPS